MKNSLIVSVVAVLLILSSSCLFSQEQEETIDWDKMDRHLFRQFKEEGRGSDAEIFQLLGRIHFDEERWDRAALYFKKAVELDPELEFSWYLLGFLHMDTEEGDYYLTRAAEARPGFSTPYYWLGYNHCANGRYEQAIPILEKYLELAAKEPEEEEGRIGFAECLLKELLAGEEGKCIRMIRKPGPDGDENPPSETETVPAAQDPGQEMLTGTRVIHFTPGLPLPDDLEVREGDCWRTSVAAPRKDAWRCMVGNEIFDPCFSVGDSGYVAYYSSPRAAAPDFLIRPVKPLPEPELSAGDGKVAWVIELADGTVTGLLTGATAVIDGKRLNYDVSPTQEEDVVILGDLHPGKVWTAEKATLGPGVGDDSEFSVIKSEMVPIRTIWR